MNIGADIPLYQHEDLLQEVLEFAREPGTHLYLAGQRHRSKLFPSQTTVKNTTSQAMYLFSPIMMCAGIFLY